MRKIGNRLRRLMHHLRGNGRRHEAVEGLGNAKVDEIDFGGDQRGIDFDGALQMAQSVLHTMAMEGLPLMASAQEMVVGFAPARHLLVLDGWRGRCGEVEAAIFLLRGRIAEGKNYADAPGQAPQQLQFQAGDAALFDQHILHPDLRAILNADHLGAQAELRGKCAEASGQDQIGFESLADLQGGRAAPDQGKDRIPRQHGERWEAQIGEAHNGLFCDGCSQMLGNKMESCEGQNGQPERCAGRVWDSASAPRRKSGSRACRQSECRTPVQAARAAKRGT